MKKGVLLCCHGTRSIKGTYDTKKILTFFKQKNKNYITKISYLEIRKPSIEDQLKFFLKRKFESLLIIPVMIFPGNHVTKDIPKILISVKKNYKYLPKITITKPLIYSKYFFSTVQKKIEKKIKLINKEDKNCIITVASNTVNLKAKSNIKSLTKKIYKQNNFNFFESILITLDKNKLKDKLENLNQGFDKFMILPIFLFRGKLLENLKSVVIELNRKYNNKFILCSHINDNKEIYKLISNLNKNIT
ncbi:MAG: Sirohydrochlorin cobaltochelatase [Alphaproteobacteria bacterium MarineAlpha6_Bin6]|nr:hypothetical protein [Pelagibacteraceae bacterium]PPR32125.1 MAG: Sirohydrochlorin cobaltochelatase [Alphaproteobacteria bacterium MarineAlpha6_Bin6]PPR32784.1 MAG: Sirohydrochlorin cobaltochelatase [Alphaproteobacteria bacterium MarineAlpha6_Bin5]|tara:strand:+ start:354 stop:1094 length:741 start_codon:yes stop_codon:yes gene_type:complete